MSSRALVSILLLALLSAFAFGCGGGGSSLGGVSSPRGGTIAGKILTPAVSTDILAGVLPQVTPATPLAGALVFIEEYPQHSRTTANDGVFSFLDVPLEKPLHLIVKHQPGMTAFRFRSEPILLSANTTFSLQNLEMQPQAAIFPLSLVIRDQNGIPLPSARITIWGESRPTDTRGQLVVAMPSCRSEIKIEAAGFAAFSQPVDFNQTMQQELEINLNPAGSINHSPQAAINANTLPSLPLGGTLSLNAQGSDPDGDAVTFEWKATIGTLVPTSPDHTRVDWIAPSFATLASISLAVKDGRGGRSAATIKVVVGNLPNVNRLPQATLVASLTSISFGQMLPLSVTANDPDGDGLMYTWSASTGDLAQVAGNTVYWTAPQLATQAVITVRIWDGKSGVITLSTSIAVTRQNQSPTLQLLASPTRVLPNAVVTLTAKGYDPDNDPLTYFWEVDKGSLITSYGQTAQWRTPTDAATATVICRVADSYGGVISASQIFVINNSLPTVKILPTPAAVLPYDNVSLIASGTDPDGDILLYTWEASVGSLSAPAGTVVTWTAPASAAMATIRLTGSDGRGGLSSASCSIGVGDNNNPTAAVAALQATAIEGLPIGVSCAATDLNGDDLSYSWSATGGSFTPNNTPVATWTAGAGPFNHQVSCTVTDGRGGSVTASLAINTVAGKNLAVGDVAHVTINGETTLGLATPNNAGRFGLVFYPLNTASAAYRFQVNGGGAALPEQVAPLMNTVAQTELMVQQGQAKIDSFLRQMERTHRPSLNRSIRADIAGPLLNEVNVGDTHQFWLLKSDGSFIQRTAELRVIGSTCKVFRDTQNYGTYDPAGTTDAMLQSFAAEFDARIYAFISQNYGDTLDKNGDTKVTILISPLVNAYATGVVGYFYSNDFTDTANSNQRDMFYVCVFDSGFWPEATYKARIPLTLVHEFQHLVNYVEHSKRSSSVQEEIWLNEGLSVESQVRYSAERDSRYDNYAQNPEWVSITNWDSKLDNYGGDGLFLRYVYEQVGTATVKALVQTALAGPDNLNITCAARGGFEGLFKDFAAALMRWGKGLPGNPRYDFQLPVNINLSPKTTTKAFNSAFTGTMSSTAFRFVVVEPQPGYTGQLTTFPVKDLDNGRLGVTIVRLNN